MITIVDTGLCNIGSVANMLRRLGVRPTIATEGKAVSEAKALILPGIGHFDAGMKNLDARGITSALHERVQGAKVPVLGICLGMQLLSRGSEEGSAPGLGWIDGHCKKFDFHGTPPPQLPVPHMGWNEVEPLDTQMFRGHEPGRTRFYFVHSFHLVAQSADVVAAYATYGLRFVAAVRRGNVWGAQFHPEKSHGHGMKLLSNYVEAVRSAA
ncbi:MAG: imidazole glycerol phosphate synthase subunit HisH [Archangium sp.]|nr:imidazole glycerol phosphate synthase subunit HisH [Archangium sp.]